MKLLREFSGYEVLRACFSNIYKNFALEA